MSYWIYGKNERLGEYSQTVRQSKKQRKDGSVLDSFVVALDSSVVVLDSSVVVLDSSVVVLDSSVVVLDSSVVLLDSSVIVLDSSVVVLDSSVVVLDSSDCNPNSLTVYSTSILFYIPHPSDCTLISVLLCIPLVWLYLPRLFCYVSHSL